MRKDHDYSVGHAPFVKHGWPGVRADQFLNLGKVVMTKSQ